VTVVNPEQWRRVEEVFKAAVELPARERTVFLDEICDGDPSLRREVASLLLHDEKAKSFIEVPAFDINSASLSESLSELAAGQTIDTYRIVKEIGSGGMGVVYLARDTKLRRMVALKLLPKQFTADQDRVLRFQQEAYAASSLNHPNILTIYDIGETEQGHYIVTEFIDGQTLRERMSEAHLSLGEVLDVILQVASSLKAAHIAGIVHRDIKPENIMIRRDGIVKVLDFGLAKLIEPPDADLNSSMLFKTRPGVLMGTPNYMSPEQVAGEAVDERSDLFSLGAVLYECISSRPAFSGSNVAAIWGEIQHVDPPPLSQLNSEIPPRLNQVTQKTLAKRPELRYQSAVEVAEDLSAVRASLSDAEKLVTVSTPRKLKTSRIRPLTTLSNILRIPVWSFPVILLLIILPLAAFVTWRTFDLRSSNKSQLWYEEGARALRNGAYLQARVALERALQAEDKYPLTYVRLAEAYLELDNREKAREALYNFNKLVPDRSTLSQRDQFYVNAVTATEARDLAGAIDNFQNIVRLSPDDPQAYLDLGRAYEKSNDSDNALANYEEAQRRDADYATAYLRRGILYGRKSQLTEAEQSFRQADDIYRVLGNPEGRAAVHYQHGVILLNVKKLDEARTALEQSLQFAQASGNESQEILTKLQLGSVYIAEGQPERAQEISREAVAQAQRLGMQVITIRGLIDMGNAYYLKGDLHSGEAKYKEALASAVSLKDSRSEARARFSLGSLLIKQGRTDEGLPEMTRARDFYVQGGYSNEAALSLGLIGQARRDKGEYDEAIRAFQEQLQIAGQLNLPPLIASVNDDIGQVLVYQEKYPAALEFMNASYDIYQALKDQLGIGYNLLNRGHVLWRLGRYSEAHLLFGQAREIAGQPGGFSGLTLALDVFGAEMEVSRRNFARAREQIKRVMEGGEAQESETAVESKRLLGLIAIFSGAKNDEGVRLCTEGVALAITTKNPWLISRSQLSLAEALLAHGNPEQALTTALQAENTYDKTKQLESSWRAWLLAARASEQLGDAAKKQEYVSKAQDVLSHLEQLWGAGAYKNYRTRPDIESSMKLLGKLAAKT
jgi:serine/threonine protein kinase/lipoprotein NlpI